MYIINFEEVIMTAVLSAVREENRNRYTDAVVAYRRTPYLLGCGSWKQFLEEHGTSSKEGVPFALVLRTIPRPDTYIMPRVPISSVSKHVFFGVLPRSNSGEYFGRSCFGRESEDFGGNGSTKGLSIVVREGGLDPVFLRLPKEDVHKLEHGTNHAGLYKITNLHLDVDFVRSMLVTWINGIARHVPPCPDEVEAARLLKVIRQLTSFARLCGPARRFDRVEQALQALQAPVLAYRRSLETERKVLHDMLRDNKRQLRNFRA